VAGEANRSSIIVKASIARTGIGGEGPQRDSITGETGGGAARSASFAAVVASRANHTTAIIIKSGIDIANTGRT
jgi:hypothetical protein